MPDGELSPSVKLVKASNLIPLRMLLLLLLTTNHKLMPGVFKYFKLYAFLVCITMPPACPLEAQSARSETAMYATYFNHLFGTDERLVSGTLYTGPARGSIEGHAYFLDDRWIKGSVEVNGKVFEGLDLKYDVVINQMILSCPTATLTNVQIGLRSTGIERITMEDHVFIPLPGSSDSSVVTYAELMSAGTINYLVTRRKYLVLTNGSGLTDYIYREVVGQFLWYNGQLTPFRRKSDLINLFPNRKVNINQFARQEKLKLSKKRLADRAKLTDFCNSLLNNPE